MDDYNWLAAGALPTILSILVDWDVNPREWKDAEIWIEALLSVHNILDVRVFFHKGEIQPTISVNQGDSYPSKSDYSEKVKMGADFGPARDFVVPDGSHIKGS